VPKEGWGRRRRRGVQVYNTREGGRIEGVGRKEQRKEGRNGERGREDGRKEGRPPSTASKSRVATAEGHPAKEGGKEGRPRKEGQGVKERSSRKEGRSKNEKRKVGEGRKGGRSGGKRRLRTERPVSSSITPNPLLGRGRQLRRAERRKGGKAEGRKDGRATGRMEGRKDGRTKGRKKKERRTGQELRWFHLSSI
jgi:hypothetical protein